MKFTEEFVIEQDVAHTHKQIDSYIEHMKQVGGVRIGQEIIKYYPHEELAHEGRRFRLELQIFPQKEWDEFRMSIKSFLLKQFGEYGGNSQLRDFQKLFDKLDEVQKNFQPQIEEK